MRRRTFLFVAVLLAALRVLTSAAQAPSWLTAPRAIAPGVEFYTSTDATLTDPPAPAAAYFLKLDPQKVTLSAARAHDEVMGMETVDSMATRHGAIAAVNAGFFNTTNGDPSTVLKLDGELISDSVTSRGVLAIGPLPRQALTFDVLSAKQAIRVNGATAEIVIDGVDTTRVRGRLMLYTPKYHADTDTAPNGVEIVASGSPLTVREIRVDAGHTPIPRDGVVLSFGGLELPPALAALKVGTAFTIVTHWKPLHDTPMAVFDEARDILNGAGLLRRGGVAISDWKPESVNQTTFVDARHPRTLAGVDDRGFVWLAAIDGRQAGYATGVNFAELQRLCDRLKLRDALNFDGGGSVTMVVNNAIVNRPSDAAGPRPVSDALLVKVR